MRIQIIFSHHHLYDWIWFGFAFFTHLYIFFLEWHLMWSIENYPFVCIAVLFFLVSVKSMPILNVLQVCHSLRVTLNQSGAIVSASCPIASCINSWCFIFSCISWFWGTVWVLIKTSLVKMHYLCIFVNLHCVVEILGLSNNSIPLCCFFSTWCINHWNF